MISTSASASSCAACRTTSRTSSRALEIDGFYSMGTYRFPCCRSRQDANTISDLGDVEQLHLPQDGLSSVVAAHPMPGREILEPVDKLFCSRDICRSKGCKCLPPYRMQLFLALLLAIWTYLYLFSRNQRMASEKPARPALPDEDKDGGGLM